MNPSFPHDTNLKCCDAATTSVGPECCGTAGYDPCTYQCCPGDIVIPSTGTCPEVCSNTTNLCIGKRGSPGVAVCTYDADDDEYRNFCDPDLTKILIVGESESNKRPVVECGCCQDIDNRNIKMNKKGKHCKEFYANQGI